MTANATPFWRRKRTWLFSAVALIPIFSLFIVTRSFVLSHIVASILQDKIGQQVEVGAAHWNWSNELTLEHIVIRASNISGRASEVITVTSATVSFNNLISSQADNITAITVDKVIIRLAESSQVQGEYNVSRILQKIFESGNQVFAKGERDEAEDRTLPSFALKELIVETGGMDNGKWLLEGRRIFSVIYERDDPNQFDIELVEVDGDLNVQIWYAPFESNIKVEIDEIQLNESLFQHLPRAAINWCKESKLQGSVKQLIVSWSEKDGILIEGVIEDINCFLEEEYGLPWAHYKSGLVTRLRGKASLYVATGQVIYDGKSISFNGLKGSLHPPQRETDAPISFSAEIKISDLPIIDFESDQWLVSLLSEAPFHGRFFIEEFQATREDGGDIYLPLAAAQILKIFQMEEWKVNAKVEVLREEFGGEVDIFGYLQIDAASGMYEGFPYPLYDVNSLIKFHQDEIEVVFLNALGSGDSTVHISGDVQAARNFLVVDLKIFVTDAPLDKTLHDTVGKQIANVMDRLLDEDALDKMLRVLSNTQVQSFSLGGEINLDLDLKHDSRIGPKVALTGEITFENIGIIHSVFPYPVTLQIGTVLLEQSGLRVLEGTMIRFEGAGGGFGELGGSIAFLDNGIALPELELHLSNEKVTDALIEAISVSAGDSYDIALGVLGGLGLDARLTVQGSIYGNPNGKIDTTFTILIEDGIATPNAKLAKAIHASSPFWPEGFTLIGLNAEVKVVNGAVSMSGASCECDTGFLDATMSIDKGEFDLVLYGIDLPLSSRFIGVIPNDASQKLKESWNWLDIGGVMDAEIRMSYRNGESFLYMEVTPTLVTISGNGQSVDLEHMRGSVTVENTEASFNAMVFHLKEDGHPQGILQIMGIVQAESSEYQFDIGASWDAAAISSPLTRVIIGMVGGEKGVSYYDSLQPSGHANATLTAYGNADSITYDIIVTPSILSTEIHGRTAEAVFNQHDGQGGNVIRFDNSGIRFDQLHGKLGEGDFTLNGFIETETVIDGEFDLTWSGNSGDSSLFAVMPSTVGDIFEGIMLSDGISKLPDGNITFTGDQWDDLSVEFKGNISLTDVSINVGIPLTKIIGTVEVAGSYSEEQLSQLQLSLTIDEMTVLGRTVSYVDGKLFLNTESQRMIFDGMRGESSTGGLTLEGWVAIDETKLYEVEILVAGIELAAENEEGDLATLQGELTGWLSIAGVQGDTSSRRGVGMLRVQNGELAVNPLSMTAMQVLQLAIPTASSITGVDIGLYIDDDRMVLDHITLTSSDSGISDLVLTGEGTIDIETFSLHARLHPRAGFPILREITGVLIDQLYSIDITGELLNPNVSVVFFPFLSR